MNSHPIGIFDSGVGGLTVLDAIARAYPFEPLIYFGDTGRYPYGVRSKAVIVEYALEITRFLEQQGCKFIVIACNTASALALDEVRAATSVGVIGVIEPGAAAAVKATNNRKVGVIATEATIASEAYPHAIRAVDSGVEIHTRACPLFVALAEEGYAGKPATRLVAEEYLSGFRELGVDTLVLGCTHYPILKTDIAAILGPDVRLVDSAMVVADAVAERLRADDLCASNVTSVQHQFFVSDTPARFQRVGERFLRRPIETVEVVDLESLHALRSHPA